MNSAEEDHPRWRYFPGAAFDVVAIAASAGGLSALSLLLSRLPEDFPACTLVVQHLDPRHRSLMSDILGRRTPLEVEEADEGKPIRPGVVYIAKPDYHMLVNPGGEIGLSRTELVHFVRPSADLLFESVAAVYRDRCIAVVLTGSGTDGSMGIKAVRSTGGTVIAQDKVSSEFFGMPGAAIASGEVDFILPLDEMPDALVKLVTAGG